LNPTIDEAASRAYTPLRKWPPVAGATDLTP
jgi:hypothetical protein